MACITPEEAGSLDAVVFLDTLAWSEGTSISPLTRNAGYDIIVGGVGDPSGGERFTVYAQHPFASGRAPKLIVKAGQRFPHGLYSDAAGRYQFMLKTWNDLARRLNLHDFSPLSQDRAALELIRQRGALAHLNSGNIDKALAAQHAAIDLIDAVEENSTIWASLPGNAYGQGGHSMDEVIAEFRKLLACAKLQSVTSTT